MKNLGYVFLPFLFVPNRSGIIEVALSPEFLDRSERIAGTWKTVLENSGIRADVYVVKNGAIAIGSSDRSAIKEVKEFLETQKPWMKSLTFNEL